MFSEFQSDARERQSSRAARITSLSAHLALLLWLIHTPTPTVLTPSSSKAGDRQGIVTQIYWPRGGKGAASSEAETARNMSQTALLNWRPPHKAQRHQHGLSVSTAEKEVANATESGNPLPPVGSPFGNQSSGLSDGADVRPALPVVSHDPHVDAADLVDGPEGDVIIEVTIDEKGNIVAKKVLRSLTPAVDLKVLAALEAWHFQPATRNGVPIASKQDVSYHFRPN